ncbi:MAG: hypothetical protein Kow0079_10010 [Vicingaceae bacterium]
MNKLKIILLLLCGSNLIAQVNIPTSNGSNLPNLFEVSNYLDSTYKAGVNNIDTGEGGNINQYKRWKYFWDTRLSNKNNISGNTESYLKLLQSTSNGNININCNNNSGINLPDWELKGPFQMPVHYLGRIDVVKKSKWNNDIAFAGAHTSGLWRTQNFTSNTPLWECITDNINVPGLGIRQLILDPIHQGEAYFIGGMYTSSFHDIPYNIGIYYTQNIYATNPVWTPLFIPNDLHDQIKKMQLIHDNQGNRYLYILASNTVYLSFNAGTPTFEYDLSTLSNGLVANTYDFIIDKNSIAGNMPLNAVFFYSFRDNNNNYKLGKLDNSSFAFSDETNNFNPSPVNKILLSEGEKGTYFIYPTISVNNNTPFKKPYYYKTENSGINYTLIGTSSHYIGNAVFKVSDADENIFYISNLANVSLYKMINNNGIINDIINTNMLHADVRGFDLVNSNLNGINDEILVGNDGGISYSNQTNTNGSTTNIMSKNGIGLTVTQFYGLDNYRFNGEIFAAGAQDNKTFIFNGNMVYQASCCDGYDVQYKYNDPNVVFTENSPGSNQSYYYYKYNTPTPSINGNMRIDPPVPVGPLNYVSSTVMGESWEAAWGLATRPIMTNYKGDLYFAFQDIWKSSNNNNTNSWDNSTWNNSNSTWNIQLSSFFEEFFVPSTAQLSDFDIFSEDENIIYAAFRHATWGQDLSEYNSYSYADANNSNFIQNPTVDYNKPAVKKVFKKTYDSQGVPKWYDITPNIYNLDKELITTKAVTTVVISNDDPNKVWMGFEGVSADPQDIYSNDLKVIVTYDGGNTWLPYGIGLPDIPVNQMIKIDGTNDGLLVGTDYGVYYTDNDIYPNNGWVCISNNLPPAIVTDLDIQYCNKKLRISTFGRGIWELDITNLLNKKPTEITSNKTISDLVYLNNDLIIKSGNTLNVTGTIRAAEDVRIIVEKGAKLILDGATLTSQCEKLWEGIEVWGDNSQNQFTQGAQGEVIIKNGTLIEIAHEAVTVQQRDNNLNTIWNTFGGIVKASNSTFKNNRRSFSFAQYKNSNPTSGQPVYNVSYIKNCDFIWDGPLNENIKLNAHITIWDNNGIKIQGNHFQLLNPNNYNPKERGIGIYTIDAAYQVLPTCNNIPCAPCKNDKNRFTNLTYGIKVENANPIKSIVVKNAEFESCIRGVYLKNMDFAEIVNNNFNIAEQDPVLPTYGLYLENCNAYEVEENNFDAAFNKGNYGIYIKNSGTANNEIYNNQLNNLLIANQSEGTNGTAFTSQNYSGLFYHCNQNNDINDVDIAVTAGKVNPKQGSCKSDESPANNLFSTATNSIWLDVNNMPIMYYYHSIGNPALFPVNNFPIGSVIDNPCIYPYNQSTSCPSRQSVSVSPITLKNNLISLKTTADSLNNVIDNGNTKGLIQTASSNLPPWQIRNELINASPYLSEEVLLAMLNNGALPNWVIQQVLTANAPLTDQVFLAMLQRTPALPDYLIHNLANLCSPLSHNEQLALINRTPALPDWLLSSVLTQHAPLFDDVMIALIERQPTVATWAVKNIIIRNTPLSTEVIDALNNHTPPYPNWLFNQINKSPWVAGEPIDQPQPESSLLNLYAEISNVEQEKQLTENELIRTYLHDTTIINGIDSVIAFLEQFGENKTCCSRTLACSYIGDNQFQKGRTTLDTLALDTANSDFCNLYNALIDLNTSVPSKIDSSTNNSTKATIQTIAATATDSKPRAAAEALLSFAGINSYNETFVPLTNNLRTQATNNDVLPGTVILLNNNYKDDEIKVYPNPNEGNFYLSYVINSNEQAVFILTDISGKELMRKPLKGTEGNLNLQLHLQPGIYIYQIQNANEVLETNKLIIIEN